MPSRRRLRSTDLTAEITSRQRMLDHRRRMDDYFSNLIRQEQPYVDEYARFDIDLIHSAMNGNFEDYSIYPENQYIDLLSFLVDLKGYLVDHLLSLWSTSGAVAFSLQITVIYQRSTQPDQYREVELNSEYYQILTYNDLLNSVLAAFGDIEMEHIEYQEGASDWTLDSVLYGNLRANKIQKSRVLRGGGQHAKHLYARGRAFLELPKWVKAKRCCVNIDNKDNMCFKYVMECALMSKLAGEDQTLLHLTRSSKYKNKDSFKYDDLEFPIHTLDIPKFEQMNWMPYNLAINVYMVDEDNPKSIAVVYSSSNQSLDAWIVNLLLVNKTKFNEQTGQTEQIDYHWTFIHSMDRLCVGMDGIKSRGKRHRCLRCLESFFSKESLVEHKILCYDMEAQRPHLPESYEAYKYFKDPHKKVIRPFVIYADFEAFNAYIEHKEDESITLQNRQTVHVPSGFCFHTVCRTRPEFNNTVWYSYEDTEFKYDKDNQPSTNVGLQFIIKLNEERKRIEQLIEENFQYDLDPNYTDKKNERCVLCDLKMSCGFMPHWDYKSFKGTTDFKNKNDYWARRRDMKQKPMPSELRLKLLEENMASMPAWDPAKKTDNYIGNCHFACGSGFNGIAKYQKIPVIFHNLSGYDSHLILKSFRNIDSQLNGFSAIPLSGDKFMSFSTKGLQFIDSIRFMNERLETLVKNLKSAGPDKFIHLKQGLQLYCEANKIVWTDKILEMAMQKGEFPYEYFDHPQKFYETSLPPIDLFYTSLNDQSITEEEYSYAKEVWNNTNCKIMKDYHNLYLVQDVFLLSDVFEAFRGVCYAENQLDPLWYVSIPGYAYDSCFKHRGYHMYDHREIPFHVELFNKEQADMYLFIEDTIRGGISMTPGRYAKANHKYLDAYDEKQPGKHIVYYDANNLYGYAMSQYLPYAEYEWVQGEEFNSVYQFAISEKGIADNDPIGYILEIDGYFPDEVHDYLSDFPPAPIKQSIDESMISQYSKNINEKFGTNHDDETDKLMCTLEPHKLYKVHYRLLHLYIKLGFKPTKCHRILQFRQTSWMKDFVDMHTQKRRLATNDFQKDFHKLVVNSTYGKSIQNNRKHRQVKSITWETYNEKMKWDPFLKDRQIITEDFVLAYYRMRQANLNSAISVGASILEHSKWLMYDFYYNTMKRIYGDKLRLIFTDTDSLCMEIQTHDIMDDMDKNDLLGLMDLADWPKDPSYYGKNYYDGTNKKIIGKFKDEMSADRLYITEVIALRSKCYSCLKSNGVHKPTLKGVKKAVQKGGVKQQGITHQDYVNCLLSGNDPNYEIQMKDIYTINSDKHGIYTNKTKKRTLNPNDTKVYLLDSTHSLPYGHYSLRNIDSYSNH